MKNAVFWDVEPCGFIINRRFGGMCLLHLQGRFLEGADERLTKEIYPEDGGDTFFRNVGLY
jgi:hypothetical protein